MTPRGLKALARVISESAPTSCTRTATVRTCGPGWPLPTGVRVPVVITSVRNRNIDPLNLLAEEHLIEGTDLVLANSEGIRRELVNRVRIPAGRVQVIHNFIDTAQFHPPSPAAAEHRPRPPQLSGELALLLPGRLTPQKHQLGLMFALWKCKREGRLPAHVRVLLAGRTRAAVYTRLVRGLVRLFGLEEQVRFLGPVTEMVSLYHAADALLLPSLYEGMPNAVIEGQVSGAAGNRVEGRQRGRSGGRRRGRVRGADRRQRRAGRGDREAVRAGDEERAEMGRRGHDRVTRMLDQEVILARMVAIYDRLLAEKAPLNRPLPRPSAGGGGWEGGVDPADRRASHPPGSTPPSRPPPRRGRRGGGGRPEGLPALAALLPVLPQPQLQHQEVPQPLPVVHAAVLLVQQPPHLRALHDRLRSPTFPIQEIPRHRPQLAAEPAVDRQREPALLALQDRRSAPAPGPPGVAPFLPRRPRSFNPPPSPAIHSTRSWSSRGARTSRAWAIEAMSTFTRMSSGR